MIARYDDNRDGLDLEDWPAGNKRLLQHARLAPEDNHNMVSMALNLLAGLSTPLRCHAIRRPTTSRDNAPCDEMNKRTNFCSIWLDTGHNKTACSKLGNIPKQPSPRRYRNAQTMNTCNKLSMVKE
jgi:hypothetical protein